MVRRLLSDRPELVLAVAGVVLLGAALGWLVAWLGSGAGGG